MDFSDSFKPEAHYAVEIGRDGAKASIYEMMRDLKGDLNLLTKIEEGTSRIDFTTLTYEEIGVVLLWAAFLRRKEILSHLLSRGYSNLLTCTPEGGLTALHLAAFSGCPECVRLLLDAGAKMSHQQAYSPLHCAALSASPSCVRLLLNYGAKVNPTSQDLTLKSQDTPLHCAIKANSPECVKELLKAGADLRAFGQAGLSPLHLTSDISNLECMRALLDHWNEYKKRTHFNINQVTQDERDYTALHIAAENNFADGIHLLDSFGAKLDEKNAKGMTPLHLACREQSVECAKALLASGSINEGDNEGRTPLHLALGRTEAAGITDFLVQVPGVKLNIADNNGFTPLHVAAVNEQVQAAAILIKAGADLTARIGKGSTALHLVNRKVPAALYAVEEVLDSAITLSVNMSSRDVEMKLDFKPLIASEKRITTDLLNTFVAEGRPELMQHPLCQAFLHMKWQEVRIFYFLRLVYYFLFICSISIYVSTVLLENKKIPESGADSKNSSLEIESRNVTSTEELNIIFNELAKWINVGHGLYWIILIEIIRKLYGLVAHCIAPTSVTLKYSLKIYVSQLDNWLEWSCLIGVAIVATSDAIDQKWYAYAGPISILIGWSNLMILIGQLPFFGAYVAMYTCVLREMGKLLIAYSSMLIGFAVCFFVIFRVKVEFNSVWKTLIKVLVMMTGELEFNNLLEKPIDQQNVPETGIEIFALVIFTIFLLLVSVVLMNLLVAIAVHDIHGLKTSAAITKLKNQLNLVGCIETALPELCSLRMLLCCCLCRKREARPNKMEGGKRRSRDIGVLSVQPHSLKIDSLPRDIVNIAYEVANRMTPYQGNRQSAKETSRHKRLYSRQNTGSVYETIIPRNDCSKRKNMNRKSKYINLDNIASNHSLLSIRFENGLRSISEEVKDIKDAYSQQASDNAELKSVLEQQNAMLKLLLEPKYSP